MIEGAIRPLDERWLKQHRINV